MCGCVVEKEIVLLHILTVIALRVRQAEEPFLHDRVGLVPQGQGKTYQSLIVADAHQSIFAPAISARAGVLMWEEIPRGSIGGIVLADGSPLTFGEIGTPTIPWLLILVRFLKPVLFCICHYVCSSLADISNPTYCGEIISTIKILQLSC